MLLCDRHLPGDYTVWDCGSGSVMVPVNPDTCRTLSDTSMETSAAMLLPRSILNSQSRGVLHEPCSARNCNELDMLGDCHEGPTTRASHGEPRSPKHLQERAR